MKYLLCLLSLCSLVYLNSCAEITFEEEKLNEREIVEGLKRALEVGTDTSVNILNKTNGYFEDSTVKILLPPESDVISKNLALIPLLNQSIVEETVEKVNRAAEDAAIEAAPIFKNAITNITVEDGKDILNGSDSAATVFLRKATNTELYNSFKPKIEESLSKEILGVSAESAYRSMITTYNDFVNLPFNPLDSIKNNSLSEHTTRKALSGLFKKVALEEKDIRNNADARIDNLLKKVFSHQD